MAYFSGWREDEQMARPVAVKERKTVRFKQLEQSSGEPTQVFLWTRPEDDKEFMRAAKENRVVTIVQRNVGSQKDYGLVGFFKRPKAAFIIFPKEIKSPPETKVVGIDYAAIRQQEPKGGVHTREDRRPPGIPMQEAPSVRPKRDEKTRELQRERRGNEEAAEDKPGKQQAAERQRFYGDVEITARQKVKVEVEAGNLKEAAQLLKAEAEKMELDRERAEIKRKVSKPKRRK